MSGQCLYEFSNTHTHTQVLYQQLNYLLFTHRTFLVVHISFSYNALMQEHHTHFHKHTLVRINYDTVIYSCDNLHSSSIIPHQKLARSTWCPNSGFTSGWSSCSGENDCNHLCYYEIFIQCKSHQAQKWRVCLVLYLLYLFWSLFFSNKSKCLIIYDVNLHLKMATFKLRRTIIIIINIVCLYYYNYVKKQKKIKM